MKNPDIQTDFLSTGNPKTNKYRKRWIILCGIIATPFAIYIALYPIMGLLGAGSYVRAQRYELYANERTIITSIAQLKKGLPQCEITDSIMEGRTDSILNYYYFITFYDTAANKVYGFWTRPETDNETTVALYVASYGTLLKDYKTVNEDMGYWKSWRIENSFKKNVLDKLGIKYKCIGNAMSILGVQF